jgi:molybdopterin-guanine dinucleotide biosynthesis protein A
MNTALPASEWTALVLAGGRGSRLGNDDKAAMTLDGVQVLDHLLSSLPDEVPVVVSGPRCLTQRPVTFRRESPVHGGPVAAIASAMEALRTPVTAILAVDMPWAGVLVRQLVTEFASYECAALVPVDRTGFRQPLCAVVRTEALGRALGDLGDPRGRSMRDLMSHMDVQERPLREDETRWVEDIDTADDLRRARSTAQHKPMIGRGVEPVMKSWINAVCAELDLPSEVNLDLILDVARVAAHNVERPAAPVTTFLLGLAVANGLDVQEAAAKIQELAAGWKAPGD